MVKRYGRAISADLPEIEGGAFVFASDYDTLAIHDKAATSFIDEIARALGWVREGGEEIVNLNDIRDEVLHWLEVAKSIPADTAAQPDRAAAGLAREGKHGT
jgi:hypothetical protein